MFHDAHSKVATEAAALPSHQKHRGWGGTQQGLGFSKASSWSVELGGNGMSLVDAFQMKGRKYGKKNVRSEFLCKCLLTFSNVVWFELSGNQAPQLMVSLSFLMNTWPWARLPSLLCHEGPVIYDSGMSHRPWQGA